MLSHLPVDIAPLQFLRADKTSIGSACTVPFILWKFLLNLILINFLSKCLQNNITSTHSVHEYLSVGMK